MKSQNFRAFKPLAVPLGTQRMFVITIRKDRLRKWEREELFLLDQEEAVSAAIYLQKKYPEAQINLNGGAYVTVEGRILQVRQQALNGQFMSFNGFELKPTSHPVNSLTAE